LGLETTKSLENFVIQLPNVSFKDLSGDEIEEELQAIFSQQGDLMVKYLVPGIAEFQHMGEGLYDTLIRVAQEQSVFNGAMDSLGLALSRFNGMTKALEIDVAQTLIELMGGIEEFSTATSDYFTEFYSEQEQMAFLTKQVQQQFASLGVALPANRDAFKQFVSGLDLTTESGQQMFAAMMKLNEAMDQFYDKAEQQAKELESWTQSISDELARLDMSPFQRSLVELKSWYDAQIAEAAEFGADTTLLERLYARKRADLIAAELESINEDTAQRLQTLTSEHDRAVSELQSTYKNLTDSIATTSKSISASVLGIRRQMAGWDEVGYQKNLVGGLRSELGKGSVLDQINTIGQLQQAIVDRYTAEMAAHQTLSAAAKERYDADLASYNALKDAAKQLSSAADALLLSELSPAKMGEQFTEAQKQFNDLLSKARGGDADAAKQLESVGSTYLGLAQDYLASGSSEYAAIFAQVQAAYRSFGSSIGAAPTVPGEVLAYQKLDAELQAAAISELEQLQLLLSDLDAKVRAEQAQEMDKLTASFESAKKDLLASAEKQISAIHALNGGMQSIADAIAAMPAPVVVVTPPPVVIPPVVVQPAPVSPISGTEPVYVGEPVTNPILERTNELLQQQLQQSSAATAKAEQQNRILQSELQRTQQLMYETMRRA
jgi:hypothetical protein